MFISYQTNGNVTRAIYSLEGFHQQVSTNENRPIAMNVQQTLSRKHFFLLLHLNLEIL